MPGTWNSPQASNDSLTREAEAMVLLILAVRGVNFRGYRMMKAEISPKEGGPLANLGEPMRVGV